jgi:Signal peptide binding domain
MQIARALRPAARLVVASRAATLAFACTRPVVDASALCCRGLHGGRPAAGLADSLRGAYESARGGADAKREARVFSVQLGLLSDPDRVFDGDRFLDLLAGMKDAAGMSGFKENLPWVQNNPALSEIKDQQAIIYAMAPAERRDVARIGIGAKKRIAKATGQSLNAVEAVLSQISSMRNVQRWLIKRKKDGLELPSSPQVMQVMLGQPDSGMSRKASPRGPNPRGPRPGVRH